MGQGTGDRGQGASDMGQGAGDRGQGAGDLGQGTGDLGCSDHVHHGDLGQGASDLGRDPAHPTALEKKLARLEWENSSFRTELDKISEQLKMYKTDSARLNQLQGENEKLTSELNKLEHLVVQLQGENDTIGEDSCFHEPSALARADATRLGANARDSVASELVTTKPLKCKISKNSKMQNFKNSKYLNKFKKFQKC
jgi:hypothetical protein